MPLINNGEVIRKLIQEAKINTAHDTTPTQLAEKILAVINVNPDRLVQVRTEAASDTASLTAIHTTSATKDTFIIGAALSYHKDVVSDSETTDIRCTPFGKGETLLIQLNYEPTVAGNDHAEITFPLPIKVARGTIIGIKNQTATASIDNVGTIYFYEVETE